MVSIYVKVNGSRTHCSTILIRTPFHVCVGQFEARQKMCSITLLCLEHGGSGDQKLEEEQCSHFLNRENRNYLR